MTTDKLGKLAETVQDHAENLCKRMRELGTNELTTEIGTLVRSYGRTNVGSYSTLTWDGSEGDLTLGQVARDGDEGSYVHGDFSSWVSAATPHDLLKYAEGQAAINRALAEYADQRENRVEAAISALEE